MKQLSNQWILFIIIVISVILRIFNFAEIPFVHDEFSVLRRLDYNSFSDIITHGVMVDGHPAGIQVFLVYWSRIFGVSEVAIKFPFIVFGVLAVYFTYLIGKSWFNETVGLLTAALVSSLQYTVMFSQIARPYISGLLFSLMLVYYLSKLIQKPEKNFLLNGILFIISASLCAYNHHFSLLFAAIVGISGAFFIKKQFLLKYILLGVGIFVLYIPHLGIFFHQLGLGGVEQWLAKPKPDFILDFLKFVFNHSYILMLAVFGISLWFLFVKRSSDDFRAKVNYKYYILFFIWFFLPLAIGYFYSVKFSSVLQFSVLIFSFTFILYLFFAHLPNYKPKTNLILVLIILGAGTYSLVFERQHYKYFYQSSYIKVLRDYEEITGEEESIFAIIQSVKTTNDYYTKTLGVDTNYKWFDDFESMKEFKLFIIENAPQFDKLYLGSLYDLHPTAIPIILEFYPYIEIENNYFGGATYLFSKQKSIENSTTSSQNNKQISLITDLNFEESNLSKPVASGWNFNPESITDSIAFSGAHSYLMDKNQEWGPLFEMPLDEITKNKTDFIDFSVRAKPINSFNGATLVVSLEVDGESIYWIGTTLEELEISDSLNPEWCSFYASLKLPDIYLNYNAIQVKTLIWNKGKSEFLIDDFKVELRVGNGVVYGVYNDLVD
jgi:hypothetical protein